MFYWWIERLYWVFGTLAVFSWPCWLSNYDDSNDIGFGAAFLIGIGGLLLAGLANLGAYLGN